MPNAPARSPKPIALEEIAVRAVKAALKGNVAGVFLFKGVVAPKVDEVIACGEAVLSADDMEALEKYIPALEAFEQGAKLLVDLERVG